MPKSMRSVFCRNAALVLVIVFASSLVLQETVVVSPGTAGPLANAGPRARYSLAVLPLEATGRISAEEASTLTGQLRSELEKTGVFVITEQSVVEAALQSAGLLDAGCSTIECGVQAGKLLSCQLVVNGSVRKVGQIFFVEAQMLHVSSGQVVQKVSEDFDGDVEGLLSFMRTVAQKLVGKSSSSSSSSSESAKTVSSEQPVQELAPAEYGEALQETGSDEPLETTEVKRGSSKFLILGLVAAGAVGAGIYLAQSGGKETNNKDNKPGNSLSDLPNPPRFP